MSSDKSTAKPPGENGQPYKHLLPLLEEPLYRLLCSEPQIEGGKRIFAKRRQFMHQMTYEVLADLRSHAIPFGDKENPYAEYVMLGYLDYMNGLLSPDEVGTIGRSFQDECQRTLYLTGAGHGISEEFPRTFSVGDFHRHPVEGKCLRVYGGERANWLTIVSSIFGPDSDVVKRFGEELKRINEEYFHFSLRNPHESQQT